jgi:inosine/xanthosine triphosphate pyrophosphatase family protein
MHPKKIVYVTSSAHKKDENEHFIKSPINGGRLASDVVQFDFRGIRIKEVLDVDLTVVVRAEVKEAYQIIQTPCIVEHAGLIYDKYSAASYPGGLTKAMWNALRDNFVLETNGAGQRATARAVIAYCNGMTIETFVGETHGTLAVAPRGMSSFYWDTVFIPDQPDGTPGSRTYAEIAADPQLGIAHKVALSQSTKAMKAFVEYLAAEPNPDLWK